MSSRSRRMLYRPCSMQEPGHEVPRHHLQPRRALPAHRSHPILAELVIDPVNWHDVQRLDARQPRHTHPRLRRFAEAGDVDDPSRCQRRGGTTPEGSSGLMPPGRADRQRSLPPAEPIFPLSGRQNASAAGDGSEGMRRARPAARLLPDLLPDLKPSHSLGLPDLPDLSWNRETSSSSGEGRRWGSSSSRVLCLPPAELVGQVGQSGSWLKSRSSRRPRSGSRSGSARPARLDQSASPSSNAPLTT